MKPLPFDSLSRHHELYWTCAYPGTPRPQLRPRVARRGAHAMMYAHKESAERQATLKSFLTERFPYNPVEGPIQLVVRFEFAIPTSWPKWRREGALEAVRGLELHTQKPDTDNLLKMVKDAASGVLWRDDCQVHSTWGIKWWGKEARTVIEIQWRDDVPSSKEEL